MTTTASASALVGQVRAGAAMPKLVAPERTSAPSKMDAPATFTAEIASAGGGPDADRSSASTTANEPVTIRPLVAHEARKVPPLEKFEGFVLRSFVESMLPSSESTYFGTGTAGEVWRSMLAEQLGDEMAKNGGIGIAASIAGKSGSRYAEAGDTSSQEPSRADTKQARRSAIDGLNAMLHQNDLSRAAVARNDTD